MAYVIENQTALSVAAVRHAVVPEKFKPGIAAPPTSGQPNPPPAVGQIWPRGNLFSR